MIPYQQDFPSSSLLQRGTEIDLSQNAASTAVALPVMQVNNTQEVPRSKLELGKLTKIQSSILTSIDSVEAQERIFLTIIRILLGRDEFSHLDEREISSIPRGRSFERLHYRNLIYYALDAKKSSFILKVHLAKLLASQRQKGTIRKMVELQLARTALARFCKSGKCYHALLNRLYSENANLPFAGEGLNQQLHASDRISMVRKALEAACKEYNEVLTINGIKPRAVQAELFDFANSGIFLRVMFNSFNRINQERLEVKLQELLQQESQALDVEENDFTSAEVCVELPFVLTDDSLMLASIPQHLKFTQERAKPSFEFSDSLKNVVDPLVHKTKFFEFLLTNWELEPSYYEQLKCSFILARGGNTLSVKDQCFILLERCLHERLKSHAVMLIKHILRIKDEQFLLDSSARRKLSRKEVNSAGRNIAISLNYVKTAVNNDFNNNFRDFRRRLDTLHSLSTPRELSKARYALVKIGNNANKAVVNVLQKDNLSAHPFNLLYIDQVLYLLREDPDFINHDILNLARFYSKEERRLHVTEDTSASFVRPIYLAEHSAFSLQDLQEPVEKKRAVETSIASESTMVSSQVFPAFQQMVSEIPPQSMFTQTQYTNEFFAEPSTSSQIVFTDQRSIAVNEADTGFDSFVCFDEMLRDFDSFQNIHERDFIFGTSTSAGKATGVLNFAPNTARGVAAQEQAKEITENDAEY